MAALGIAVIGSSPAVAQKIIPEVKQLSNDVMLNIYYDVVKARFRNRELADFGQQALTEDKKGFYRLQYSYSDDFAAGESRTYEFGVAIVGQEEMHPFQKRRRSFVYEFPLLGIKMVGFQQKFLVRQYDITEVAKQHKKPLVNKEQESLPLRLTLTPSKTSFRVGESVEFMVSLKNASGSKLKVKGLNTATLVFLIDGESWEDGGEQSPLGKRLKHVVLKPDEALTKTYKIGSYPTPRDFDVDCSYVMSYQGVHPTDTLHIEVRR